MSGWRGTLQAAQWRVEPIPTNPAPTIAGVLWCCAAIAEYVVVAGALPVWKGLQWQTLAAAQDGFFLCRP